METDMEKNIEMISAINDAVHEVRGEVFKITHRHGPFNSLHEAWGVLMEEMQEFADEVMLKAEKRDHKRIREELMQVAACAIKTMVCFTGTFTPPAPSMTFMQAQNIRATLVDAYLGAVLESERSRVPFMWWLRGITTAPMHPQCEMANTYIRILNDPSA